ncbi:MULTISPECIES: NAD(P)H-binding protein [unclassified Stenotrophomonas]|uniref:NAD(P)H-binding protein n=1 Tax=unclassified Stenotrophomonas TaxID=196198 RepID=UPI000D16621A|nr:MULTISPECIES: NAD(P)H-binding protein [unclassified Stenotrophomonas]PTA72735.1 epimerase [Stenotrophomonas sp. Nf1]PTA82440.1 epimerase [Stenotrophomonas sp. Nf4]
MKVLLFGATGMVGQGVLRECLAASDVQAVTAVGRTSVGMQAPKLRDLVHSDLFNLADIATSLKGFDACFFCLGVSSAGLSEAVYTRLTYDLTLTVANLLVQLNPKMTFIYVSAAGADASGREGKGWARVKGNTESALFNIPFRAVYVFRPLVIQPLHGARSKNTPLRLFYQVTSPALSLLRWLKPRAVLTTETMGQAMLNVTRLGVPAAAVLSPAQIYAAAATRSERANREGANYG